MSIRKSRRLFKFPKRTTSRIRLQFTRGLAAPTSNLRVESLLRPAELRFPILRWSKVLKTSPSLPFRSDVRLENSIGLRRLRMHERNGTDCGNDRSQRSSYCDNTRSCCIGRRHVGGRNFVAAARKVWNGSTTVATPRSPSPGALNIIKAHHIETSSEERPRSPILRTCSP